MDCAFGLIDYGARWYDPALGRFIQPDTIVPNPGDVQSFDRYAYVLNNPLKYTDPTGHTVEPRCPYCNIQWFDYSGTPSWLNTAVDGLAVAGCFFAGCHADTEKDTVTGPTEQEAAYAGMDQVIGVGLTPIGAVTQATSRASRRLIQHGDELLGLSTVPRHVLDNALKGVNNRTLTSSGGNIVTLTKERLGHILTRHHPSYWGAWQHLSNQIRSRNSAFDAGLSIDDVIGILQETLKAPGQSQLGGALKYIQEGSLCVSRS